MKVAYLKYADGIDISTKFLGPGGETEISLPLIKEMVERGWDVSLYSFLKKRSEVYYQEVVDGVNTNPDAQWVKNLKLEYKKVKLIDPDTDLVICSNGPTNTNFGDGRWNMPAIARTNWLITNYKGVVFYKQTDPDLFFVFFPEMYSRPFMNDYLPRGTCAELQKNKKWCITTPMRKFDGFHDHYTMVRPNYAKLKPDVKHLEYHYSAINNVNKLSVRENPILAPTYIGRERGRNLKFRAFYGALAKQGVPVDIWGKWSDDTKKSMPEINWKGFAPQGKVNETYNEYLAHIVIGDQTYEKFQMFSSRFFESIVAKTIPLVDEALTLATSDIINTPFLKDMLLVNASNVREKFERIKNLSFTERKDLSDKIVSSLTRFSPKTVADNLELLYKEERKIFESKGFKDKSEEAWEILNDMITTKLKDPKRATREFGKFQRAYIAENCDAKGNFLDRANPKKQAFDQTLAYCLKCGKELKKKAAYFSMVKCRECKGLPDEVEPEREENLSLFGT